MGATSPFMSHHTHIAYIRATPLLRQAAAPRSCPRPSQRVRHRARSRVKDEDARAGPLPDCARRLVEIGADGSVGGLVAKILTIPKVTLYTGTIYLTCDTRSSV